MRSFGCPARKSITPSLVKSVISSCRTAKHAFMSMHGAIDADGDEDDADDDDEDDDDDDEDDDAVGDNKVDGNDKVVAGDDDI